MPYLPRRVAVALACVCCVAAPAAAASRAVELLAAIPARGPIVVDGVLSDETWQAAPAIVDLIQREPTEGIPASERTEARIAFDEHALYVGVHAFDRDPSRIVGLLTRRDQRSPSDWIRVIVDSYLDKRTAYEFAVNPVGVQHDRYWFNDTSNDDSWDAVWDAEVTRNGDGWCAEFRIPFSQLRFATGTDTPVGFALVREIGRLAETSSWPLLARSAPGYVSSFAELQGVQRNGSMQRLELIPYTVGQVTTIPREEVNPLRDRIDRAAALGVDLKYALTPGVNLTATANPDFGQVEADPAVVNLDAFEVLFQERRPFFVEGSGIFQFGIDCNDGNCTGLFYSRRIGRTPQRTLSAEDDEFVAAPDAATIFGAAKLNGRVGRFTVGALSAVTSEERALKSRATGFRVRESVEPLSAYTVLRARREFSDQSTVGVMLTSTNRRIIEGLEFLPSGAYTGGVDYDWRLGNRYSVTGYLAGSRVQGESVAIQRLQENTVHAFQRPDADHVELDPFATALGGHAGSIAFAKISGERTRFSANYGYKSPGFEINDLGFQRRADERLVSHWFQVRHDTPGRYVRSLRWNLNQWAGWNFAGDRLFSGGNINMHWIFQNNLRTGFGFNVNAAPFRDRITRGGPGVRGNGVVGLWYYLDADDRRSIFPGYNGFHETDGQGTVRHNIGPRVTWRPNSSFSLSTGFRYSINDDDAQWVENVSADAATRYVFARIAQRTAAMTIRVNYTLTPDLSIQSYAEPFVSTGAYSNFRALTDGRAGEYRDRYQPFVYAGDPDFNTRSFRTTNVLRWEYKPGSALFAVWQQRRSGSGEDGEFQFGRDLGGTFGLPASNVFLIKLTYWLNR